MMVLQRRTRILPWLLGLVVVVGLLPGSGATKGKPQTKRPPNEVERIREDARAGWAPWREAAANLFVISASLAGPGLLVFAGARAWRRRRFVRVGLGGRLPVLESEVAMLSAEVVRSINAARQTRAGRSPGPRYLSQTLQVPELGFHQDPGAICPQCAASQSEDPREPRR
ncbi:MAG: hypothetical protein ACRDJF_08725 [Actinomycetota bacterium]